MIDGRYELRVVSLGSICRKKCFFSITACLVSMGQVFRLETMSAGPGSSVSDKGNFFEGMK